MAGDNLATPIAMAKGADILYAQLHFDAQGVVKEKRAVEGQVFRRTVHDCSPGSKATCNQGKFDQVWPYFHGLAHSSPDEKLTLAKGLNSSLLHQNTAGAST